jgi:glycosyltransferase involved in cell wall biosynthesis
MTITSEIGQQAKATSAMARHLRVLVLDEEFPFPPNAGKRIRSWNLLRRLAQRHALEFMCFGPVNEDARAVAQSVGIRLHVIEQPINKTGFGLYFDLFLNLFSRYPYSVSKHYTSRFRQALAALLAGGRFDLVHCEWSPYVRYLPLVNGLPTSVSAHNVESQIWQRRAEHDPHSWGKAFFALQAKKMERFERRALRSVAAITAVSDLDAETFSKWGLANVTVVDNGVDIDAIRPTDSREEHPADLLFIASLDWFPNQDALWYFLDEIFPLIRKSDATIGVRVVGRRLPSEQATRLGRYAGVEFVGEVPDVRTEYARSSIVLVPLRIGGGSRLKILEALATGKTVVSTSIGAEGLAVENGRELVIADAPAEFAEQVLALLRDPDRRRQLGANGRRLVETRYSWDSLVDRMDAVWLGAVERSA